MIDFHCHILPEMDDGSRNMEMSLEMLRLESEQGISTVVATPHFYAEQDSVGNFLKRRNHSLDRLMRAAAGKGQPLIAIQTGAEVYYFRNIGEASLIQNLHIGDSHTLLLELPFCQWEPFIYEDVVKLIRQQELKVVLAHVERYYKLQKDRGIWNAILELPVYCQMNAGAFLDWKRRRKSFAIMKAQKHVLLGSDAHNLTSRSPNLGAACAVIEKKVGAEYLEAAKALAYRLLEL